MIEPRVRLLVSFLLIAAVALMVHWYLPAVISLSCAAAAVKLNSVKTYIKKLVFPLTLALFVLAVQSLNIGFWTISISPEGISYGLLIFSRVLASASVLALLTLTTSEADLLESMRWLRVPGTAVEISLFMSRYIKTFSADGKKLKLAQESRCGFSKRSSYSERIRNTASICAALIARALSRSDGIYRAMLSRAWKPGSQYLREVQPLRRGDIISGVMLSSGAAALVIFDRFI